MASPLSRNMIAGAIGESGALTSTLPPRPLAETEKDGVKFAESAGAADLAALRAMNAESLLEHVSAGGRGAGGSATVRFGPNLDGYFLPKTLTEIFKAGQQSKVPLLAGSNSEEAGAFAVLGQR